MLKAMDAILFGPPVYDNTIKDFVLILSVMIAIAASVTVMQLKRQNSKIEAQLEAEHDRIQKLDEGWSDLDLNRQTSENHQNGIPSNRSEKDFSRLEF